MANYATLKAAIQQVIKTNGNNEITGALLQQSLLSMINSLGAGYQFVGVADTTTVPGTPDQNVFYIAGTAGTYVNFGSLILDENEVAILKYNGTWAKDVVGAASSQAVQKLSTEVTKKSDEWFVGAYKRKILVTSGQSHSSNNDRILVDIKAGTKFGVYVIADDGAISVASVFVKYGEQSGSVDIGRFNNEFTAANDITSVGLYWGSSAATTGNVFFVVVVDEALNTYKNNRIIGPLKTELDLLDADERSLRVETMGYEYDGAFNITSSGDHSSDVDRIVFDSIIPAGNYKISLLTGTTGNNGYATLYVKYIGQSGTTSIGVIKIGSTANFVFADSVESIGIYMNATTNQHAGTMPLLIVSTESLNQRLSNIENLDLQKIADQVISNPIGIEGKNLVSGRNAVLPISLIGGTTYHIVVDVFGAQSRLGTLYPGWYNGSTSNIITVPDSAKPAILSSVSHIEFDYTPEQDYPNGLFGISNYNYDASNIQSVNVTITNVTLTMRLDNVEQAIEEISEGVTGETIFSFNPEVEVKQKLSQLVMPFSLSGVPVADSVVSFLHFSDIHAQKVNLERIMAFAGKYTDYLKDVISSGDQIAEQISNSFAFWNECGAQKVLLAIGNHETWQHGAPNDESDPASQADCYAKYFGNIAEWGVVSPGVNLCYYYKDYNTGGNYKFRLIVIDCMHIDSAQTTWFTNVLNDAKTNGYSVAIMSHYSPSVLSKVQFNNNSTFTCLESPRTWSAYGTVAPFELIVKDYIDAGGLFVTWLVGHTHFDFFGLSEHGQPIICVECATTQRTDRYDARIIGTKTQDSFNIISFDLYRHVLRVVRIGNDIDRLLRPKQMMSYNYLNKIGIFNS